MDYRFVLALKAIWCIFGFFIHEHHRMSEQNVVYEDGDDLWDVIRAQEKSVKKFKAWMHCNSHNDFIHTLTYV